MNPHIKYNQSGYRYLLNWWTHNTQGRLIVSEYDKGILTTLKRIATEYKSSISELQIGNYLRVELVQPSLKDQKQISENLFQNELLMFENLIFSELACNFRDDKKSLPPRFSICTCELYCGKCNCGIISDYSKEELYEKYYDKYFSLFSSNVYNPPQKKPDFKSQQLKARIAIEDEEIYLADDLVGGRIVKPSKVDFDICNQSEHLFFFKIVEEKDLSALNSKIQDWKGEAFDHKKRQNNLFKQRFDLCKTEKQIKLLELFSDES